MELSRHHFRSAVTIETHSLRTANQRSSGAAAQSHHVPADLLVATLAGHLAAEHLCCGALALAPEELHGESFHFVAAKASIFLTRERVYWIVVAAVEFH